MTQLEKLYAQLIANRGDMRFADFLRIVEAFGFVHVRTKGSHQSYAHSACPRLLVLQPKGKDAKRYQVREFLDMVEQYGLTLDD